MQLDSMAYANRLRHLPPGQKLLFALSLLLLVLVGHQPLQVAVVAWMSIWIVGYARIQLAFYGKLIGLASLFLLASLPALLIQFAAADRIPANALLAIPVGSWTIYISKSGAELASVLASRSLASFACLAFILLTIPFAEMMHVLRRLRVPVLITELLLVMYRFVFVIWEVAGKLWIGQQSRGGYGGIRAGLRDGGMLVKQLFIRTLQRYQQLSVGLAARGFQGELRVVSIEGYSRSPRYEREALLGIVLLIVLEWMTGGY